jgi:hypothetical protein
VSTKRGLVASGVPLDASPSTAAGSLGSGRFVTACAALGAVLVVLYLWLAHREYFFGDDLYFLRKAQMPRDWGEVFVSFKPRGWWSYRPLSIEVYFSTLYAVAGLNPFPYLVTSLIAHFAAGYLVYRLALQLGIARSVALAVALLKVALFPSLNGELFWISAFQTVLGSFFYLLTVSLFIDYLTQGRRIFQVAASVAMVLTLLSNELGMTLPGPLVLLAIYFGSGDLRARVLGALRAALPMIVILGLYLPFRYVLIIASFLPTPGLNRPHLGWHIPWNVLNFLRILAKRSGELQLLLLLTVATGWAAAARMGDGALGLLARRLLLVFGWMLCAMVPFLGAYFLHHRAAIVLEGPFCLLLAIHLDPIVRAAGTLRRGGLVEVAMIVLLLVAFPYQAVGEQLRMPRGQVNRDLLALLAAEPNGVPEGACVRIQPRPEDTWTSSDLFALRFATSGLFASHYPKRTLEVPPEPGTPPPAPAFRPKCSTVIDVELLHGVPAMQATFELRRKAS